MKHLFLSLVAATTLFTALSAGENLLSNKWWNYGKTVPQATRTCKDGVLSFKNTAKVINGYSNTNAKIAPNKFREIKISGEVKATNVNDKDLTGNFCIYLDIELANGKMSYGNQIVCKAGTYDWVKVSKTFKLNQPIKKINYYVLFRNITGEAQFRNLSLEAIK